MRALITNTSSIHAGDIDVLRLGPCPNIISGLFFTSISKNMIDIPNHRLRAYHHLAIFQRIFLVFEQKLFMKYHLDPLEVVGYEGLFGLCGFVILLPILNFVPCSFEVEACVFSYEGFGFI